VFAHWRETPASKPSLMVRGSGVIKLAARPNQLACQCHDVQSSVWRFHQDNRTVASLDRF